MLTHARLRDEIAARTGYKPGVVAHVLVTAQVVIREELLQQGEVVLKGLFRVVPIVRQYNARRWRRDSLAQVDAPPPPVRRIVLTIKPVRALRLRLSAVPLSG